MGQRTDIGRLDILVNDAAIFLAKPMAGIREEDYDVLFVINSRGMLFACQAVV